MYCMTSFIKKILSTLSAFIVVTILGSGGPNEGIHINEVKDKN